ncbi:MAG: squalene/phytoene synthase family protein [Caulobacteraceae bacterium]|nr:squalene/phytoene synthase family protein [Caulobacteraceae bacterium]
MGEGDHPKDGGGGSPVTGAPANDLDEPLRQGDPDRWLSSRFIADPERRADVIALYAFDRELSQVLRAAREPLMAEIRLTWWSEGLDEVLDGRPPPGHPVLAALARAIARHRLADAPLRAMLEARFEALEAPIPADAAALEARIDATDGAVMALATAVLAGVDALAIRPAAQAWGLARRLAEGDAALPLGWDQREAARKARSRLAEARRAARALPVAAFPAVAHVALAGPYLAGRRPLGLEKRLRLTWAVLTGRI